MSGLHLAFIYFWMLVFDIAVLAGTAFLVSERGWSAWWMLLAVLITAGSNPRNLVNVLKGKKE